MSRPEHSAPPEIFYGKDESHKYSFNSRIMEIQSEMTNRAIELLNLPEDSSRYILDIGCGSGLSGQVLEEHGHQWVGMDISPAMLDVALERGVDGDLFLSDIGQGKTFSLIQGMGYRAGVFDGAISISVIQWLCNADKSDHVPRKRLMRFFSTLFSALARGARAIFQFYPENSDQIDMIVSSATKAGLFMFSLQGFSGGLLIDYPNSSKAKKFYLCLFAGYNSDEEAKTQKIPQALGMEDDAAVGAGPSSVLYASKRQRDPRRGKAGKKGISDKDWILKKKDLYRLRGKKTATDSKFTARKRKPRF